MNAILPVAVPGGMLNGEALGTEGDIPAPEGMFIDGKIPVLYGDPFVPDRPPEPNGGKIPGEPVIIYDVSPPACRRGRVLSVVSGPADKVLRLCSAPTRVTMKGAKMQQSRSMISKWDN